MTKHTSGVRWVAGVVAKRSPQNHQRVAGAHSRSSPRGLAHFALTTIFTFALISCVTSIHADDHASYTEPELSEYDREHWSFRPLEHVEVPEVDSTWPRNEIDQFIAARLSDEDLQPQPIADRRTLIRRLSYDLTGLPPTPEELEAFTNDKRQDAYAQLVDRLLNSPRYGERWAQFWLDLARFAETDGFEHDKVRPDAWKYRDWVIKAFNSDMPYDKFIQLQLAGDELHPDDEDARTATRFCLSGPDMIDINLMDERRHNLLNEMTSTVGEVILGLQVGCAQCHDHIYDPISQADFYRLRAIFEPSLQLKYFKSLTVLRETVPYEQTSHLMIRGDFRRPGMELQPGVLRVLSTGRFPYEPKSNAQTSGRRTALANWLTHLKNPLTARVIVNRIWQHHFGTGIVSTPSEFGTMGGAPVHAELLDWLAGFLIDNEWSLKTLHRQIVMSATYRQRSYLPEDASQRERNLWQQSLSADPDARLLSRYPRWRLEGEAIRDAMLSAAGQINFKQGGPGIRPPLPKDVVKTLLKNQWEVTPDIEEHNRRSVYIFARRNLRYPIFEVFDRPSANSSCPERHVSTTAPQSLHLLNSEFTLDSARAMAGLIQRETDDRDQQIDLAFLRTLSRIPTTEERLEIDRFWQTSAQTESEGVGPLAHLCLSLFNCNEFIFVD